MKISRSTGYGMLAMGYIAKNQDQKIILSNTISEEYNIPLEYLLKIMQQMVRANILRSKRGPRGGFSLAKPIKKITMLEIIEAVEGPMLCQLNLAEQSSGRFVVRSEKAYEKGIEAARAVFAKINLSDLL